MLLVGDLNIYLLDTNSSSYLAYTECFSGYGLETLIKFHTRCSNFGNSLLDHSLTNADSSPASGVISVDITDHYTIFVTFNAITRHGTYVTTRFKQDTFINAISSTNWSSINSITDPEAALDTFPTLFLKAVSDSTETVHCKKKYRHPCNPWMSSALLTRLTKNDSHTKRQKDNCSMSP